MSEPLVVDLPHRLGAEEARRRIARGVGRIEDHLPRGAEAEHAWVGDRLNLRVTAMAQQVSGSIEVREDSLRVELMLPPALSFLSRAIEAALRRKGTQMLEDKGGRGA
jgi:hypothetical protein